MQLLHIKKLHDEVDCSSDNYVTSAARKLVVQVVKYNHVIQKEKPNLSISSDPFLFHNSSLVGVHL